MTKQQVNDNPDIINPDAYKKAIELGRLLSKEGGLSKAEITRQIYPLIKDESRAVIAMAFVDGAGLTLKGAMTYLYNIKRKSNNNK